MSDVTTRPRLAASRPPAPAGRIDRLCVGIATRGRPGLIGDVIARIEHQTLRPTAIIVAATSAADVAGLVERPGLTVLIERPGLARQRNAILRHRPEGTDAVVFFDDDFVAHADWLAEAAAALQADPGIACVTGDVVADGIIGPGIPFETACALADAVHPPSATQETCTPYGCNMAIRCAAIGDLAFDERLVLYGWLEDRDFGGALARRGWRMVKAGACRGVHMGIKSGRMPGRRLGYSQVVNPVYLVAKGTERWPAMANSVFRNLASNLVKSLRPEPYVDRFGRLRGNAIALCDLARGRLTPERAEHL